LNNETNVYNNFVYNGLQIHIFGSINSKELSVYSNEKDVQLILSHAK